MHGGKGWVTDRGDPSVALLHVDTDIGGDTDDLCALAMLLGWPGVDLAGVTTCSDGKGMRAGLASYALRLAGCGDIPVAYPWPRGRRDPSEATVFLTACRI